VLAPGFYARQNIRTPVRIAIVTLIATQLMNAALIVPLKHAGLALSIGLGACLNAGLLYRKLRQHGIYSPRPGWGMFALKVAAALAAMAVVLWPAMGPERWWLAAHGAIRAAAIAGLVLLGAACTSARSGSSVSVCAISRGRA
jgi:putative peptidoglycan lipid II flippase